MLLNPLNLVVCIALYCFVLLFFGCNVIYQNLEYPCFLFAQDGVEYTVITVPEGADLSEVTAASMNPGVTEVMTLNGTQSFSEVMTPGVVEHVAPQGANQGLPDATSAVLPEMQAPPPVYVDASTGLSIDPKDLKYYILDPQAQPQA